MSNETIDVETVPATPAAAQQSMAVARVQGGAVGKALTEQELHERLEFVRRVMKKEMREGVDYGKISGAGDKPSLLQPGAQKLLMTFNLRAIVGKEVLREHGSLTPYGHREYEFTIRVFPNGGDPAREGTDGVGTCSTLESKYRYRKAQLQCPNCGKHTVIVGKADFGGGFVCWKKKGGCEAKFASDDVRMTSQPTGDVENDDPADQWNTVRKMSFKRGLVAGVINFTNTSELWTQDIEDMDFSGEGPKRPSKAPVGRPGTSSPAAAKRRPVAPQAPAPAPANKQQSPPAPRYPSDNTRKWLIEQLADCRDLATEYFRKLGNCLMPNENLEDLPLQWVPVTRLQLKALKDALAAFGNGEEIYQAYAPNALKPGEEPKKTSQALTAPVQPPPGPAPAPAAAPPPPAQKPAPRAEAPKPPNKRDPEWFFDIIVPVPPAGVKRAEYIKAPDTIRSLYTRMKEGDEEAGKRLWGFANHYEPKPWTGNDGQTRQPSNADLVFRDALDAFLEWHERHGKDTEQQEPRDSAGEPTPEDVDGSGEDPDEIPF